MSTSKNFMSLVALCCGALIGYYYGTRQFIVPNKKPRKKEVHEVIMFYDEGLVSTRSYRNLVTPPMERIMYYLNLPSYTLDVCMYVMTNPDFCNILLQLHARRVKLRVIVDAEMAYATKSYFIKLKRYSIEVRWMKSVNIMHHKFCLIDASTDNESATPLLMNGSLNWTKQATHGNYENVIVTSQRELVEGYKKEFERLWHLFRPIV